MAQLAKNVDVSKLRYSELKTLASGAKSVYVNYGNEKLTIQTPLMSLPYGLGEPYEVKEAAKTGAVIAEKDKKYDLTMSFRDMESNPKVKIFHDKMKEIETKLIDDAFTNRLAWFKDDFDGNKSFVSKLFTPIVKIDKDPNTGKPVGKYPPTFKAKLPFDQKSNTFAFDSFDMDNNEIDFETIMNKLKSAKVQLIIQLTGLWFAGGKYGCSWKIISSKFQLYQNNKIAFIEDSDNDKSNDDEEEDDDDVSVDRDVLKGLKLSDDDKNTVPVTPLVVDDDEDEEEEDDDEEVDDDEPEPEPEPVPEPPKPAAKPAVKKAAKK